MLNFIITEYRLYLSKLCKVIKGWLILFIIFVIVIYLLKKAKFARSVYSFTPENNITIHINDILTFKNSSRRPRIITYLKTGRSDYTKAGIVTSNFLYHQNEKDLIYGKVFKFENNRVYFEIVRSKK